LYVYVQACVCVCVCAYVCVCVRAPRDTLTVPPVHMCFTWDLWSISMDSGLMQAISIGFFSRDVFTCVLRSMNTLQFLRRPEAPVAMLQTKSPQLVSFCPQPLISFPCSLRGSWSILAFRIRLAYQIIKRYLGVQPSCRPTERVGASCLWGATQPWLPPNQAPNLWPIPTGM